MAKLHDQWTVLPHGPLTEVEPGLLTVVGQIPMPLGNFPRRMTVVALSRDRLAVFSPIALQEPAMKRIEELGSVAFIIVPNGYHRLDAGPWKKRYPGARVLCPPGAKKRVAEAVEVDATADMLRDKAVRFATVAGTGEAESALVVRRESGTTLIVNDIIANVRHPRGLGAHIMARLFGFGVHGPQMPREVRHLFLKDKRALAERLRQWAAMPDLKRIIPSHGDIIDRPERLLEQLADGLDKRAH
jgi:hypothetical protein